MNTTKHLLRIFTVVFLLGLVFDYFFSGGVVGVSVSIFVGLLYAAYFFIIRPTYKQEWFSWVLLFAVLMLSCTFFLFANPVLRTINLLLLPCLIFFHFIIASEPGRFTWFDIFGLQQLVDKFQGGFHTMFLPVTFVQDCIVKRETPFKENMKKVLVGLLISIPLLIVVLSLLSSADQVFASYMAQIYSFIAYMDLPLILSHGTRIIIATLFLLTLYISIRTNRVRLPIASEIVAHVHHLTNYVVLGLVNVAYLLFVAVQFTFLFGGEKIVAERGLTYSAYAVRGFWELMAVSVINIVISLIVLRLVKHDTKGQQRATHLLLLIMMFASIVMLVSAHMRLSLYELAFGYTYARVFAHTIIALLAVLLFFMCVKILRPTLIFMKVVIVASLLLFVGLNYINVDAFIFQKNIERFTSSGKLDRNYLMSLSLDAVPIVQKYVEQTKDVSFSIIENAIRTNNVVGELPWFQWNSANAYGIQKNSSKELRSTINNFYKKDAVHLPSSPDKTILTQLDQNAQGIFLFDLKSDRAAYIKIDPVTEANVNIFVSIVWLDNEKMVYLVYDKKPNNSKELMRKEIRISEVFSGTKASGYDAF